MICWYECKIAVMVCWYESKIATMVCWFESEFSFSGMLIWK
jgi:hypothetical protein